MVALLAVDARHIKHADIHADVAHIVGFLTIHQAVATPIAEVAIESVGITDRNGSDAAVTVEDGTARIADAVSLRHITNLQDGSLERRHII